MAKMTRKKIVVITIIVALAVAACVTGGALIANRIKDEQKSAERARLVKEYFEQKIAAYHAENELKPDFEVVFLGDSLTDGCDISKYYPEYVATNRGIGGDTSYGLLERMQVSAYDTNPKVIVLLIGGNDMLGGKSNESIYSNYEKIITGIREKLPETEIVWCSLTAMGSRWAEFNDTAVVINQKIKLLAKKYGCTFVDLFTPLCNVETGEIFAEYTVEGVHFTDDGYRVVTSIVKESLKELLGH